jgi:Domain of unknown function (DUF5664)
MAETAGNKDDAGKPRYKLILGGMALCIHALTLLAEFGASKYGDNNWQKVENGADRYMEAMQRHLLSELANGPGAIDDGPEGSGLPHATAIAWNALAYLWFILQGKY